MALKEYKILGARCVAVSSVAEYKEHINAIIKNGSGGYSVAINAEKVMMYQESESLRDILDNCALPSPDGAGAIIGLKILHGVQSMKIDLPRTSLLIAHENKYKVYVVGATKEVNDLAVENIGKLYPDAIVVGNTDGFFKDEAKIIDEIKAAQPNLIMVALGTPKQELLARKINKVLPSALIIGCGGALDVLAGKVKRAPKIIQEMHIEWLWRLLANPTRIKRQKVLPVFLFKLIVASLKK